LARPKITAWSTLYKCGSRCDFFCVGCNEVKTCSHFDKYFHSFLTLNCSSVWQFFKKANDDGSICQICMRTAKTKVVVRQTWQCIGREIIPCSMLP
jgi:hypothetical protein